MAAAADVIDLADSDAEECEDRVERDWKRVRDEDDEKLARRLAAEWAQPDTAAADADVARRLAEEWAPAAQGDASAADDERKAAEDHDLDLARALAAQWDREEADEAAQRDEAPAPAVAAAGVDAGVDAGCAVKHDASVECEAPSHCALADVLLGPVFSGASYAAPLAALAIYRQRDTWSCGFRCLQTLLRAVAVDEGYCAALRTNRLVSASGDCAATLKELQRALAAAWAFGFDVEGARQLNGKIVGTKKWVGSVELAMVLRHAMLRANTEAFAAKVHGGKEGAAKLLCHFCRDYFGNNFADGMWDKQLRPPLVLTASGHNVVIVGVDEMGLVLLDPQSDVPKRKAQKSLRAESYEVLFLRPGLVPLQDQKMTPEEHV
ncbi:peptidase family C78-domain-containing protein [Pelagophyceae sp. CCMP2097]|nr:peptidase family C78-domain-containing protein [Pelagophyceae sp. CCMP2097]